MEEMKNCPYCAEQILALAKKCKHCGEYLDMELKNKPAFQEGKSKTKVEKVKEQGCFLQTMNAGCMVVFVIIAIIIAIIAFIFLHYK